MKRETSRFRSSLSQIAETALTEPKSLQHKKKKFSQAPFQKKLLKMEKLIEEKLSTLFHHDSITGTSKKMVAQDYLLKAVSALENIEWLNLQALKPQMSSDFLVQI